MVQAKFKIESDPEVEKKVNDLRAQGWGYKSISDYLKDQMDVEASHMAIKRYVERKGLLNEKIIASNEELQGKLEKEVFSTFDDLKKINTKVKDLMDDVDIEERPDILLGCMKEIREQIILQNKLLGTLKPQTKVVQNIQNYVDYSVHVTKILKNLQQQGYIKILKDIKMEA